MHKRVARCFSSLSCTDFGIQISIYLKLNDFEETLSIPVVILRVFCTVTSWETIGGGPISVGKLIPPRMWWQESSFAFPAFLPPFNIGWPQLFLWEAVVKRVSLCRVAVDWPAEGQAGGDGIGTWKFWHYLSTSAEISLKNLWFWGSVLTQLAKTGQVDCCGSFFELPCSNFSNQCVGHCVMNPNAAQATLGVTKGEVIAVSKEAARAKLQLYDVWVSVGWDETAKLYLQCAGKTFSLNALWPSNSRSLGSGGTWMGLRRVWASVRIGS